MKAGAATRVDRGREAIGFGLLAGVLLVLSRQLHPGAFGLPLILAVRTLGLVLFLAAACGWGLTFSRWLRSSDAAPGSSPAWALALGLAATATILAWIAPWVWPGGNLALVWVGAGLSMLLLRRHDVEIPVLWSTLLGSKAAIAAVVAVGFWPLSLALAVPTAFDSQVYHLALPEQFALAGRAFPTPWNAHGFFPFGGEVLFALIWPLGDEVLPALLHLVVAMATVMELGRLAGELGGVSAGRWMMLAYSSIPALSVAAGGAYTDFFVLLPLVLVAGALSRPDRESGRELEMALLLGAAAAAKTNGLIGTLLIVVPWLALRGPRKLAVAAIGLGSALPWTLSTFRATGDLFFPLISSSPQAQAVRNYHGGRGWRSYLDGILGSPSVLDEALGPAVVLALIAVLFRQRRDPAPPIYVGAIALLFPLALVFFRPTSRFLAPGILLGLLFAAAPLGRLLAGRRRWLVAAALGLTSITSWTTSVMVWNAESPLLSALGLETPQTRRLRSWPQHQVARILEANTSPDEAVLVVGESRILGYARPAYAGSFADPHPLSILAPNSPTPQGTADVLLNRGIRWVAYTPAQCFVGARPSGTPFENFFFYTADEEQRFVELLESRSELVWMDQGVSLYRLSDGPVAGQRAVPRCLPAELAAQRASDHPPVPAGSS